MSFDWRTVGDPGNPEEPTFTFGAVPYVFSMSRCEVTNDQYTVFLNAKAGLGAAHDLYEPEMGSDPRGGIARSGSGVPGDPYVFSVRPDMGNKPVTFVTWFDAARFVNWLENGQGDGDTETGTYELLGGNPVAVERDVLATYFLPSEDEWFKAAYYDPTVGPDHYWGYPTAQQSVPGPVHASPTGDVANPGPSVANTDRSADWNGLDGHVTSVGSAGPLAVSHYGCADLAGNAYEWTDTPFVFGANVLRIMRGGSWIDGNTVPHKSVRFAGNAGLDTSWRGFRVVKTEAAEPGAPYCFGVGCPCGNDDAEAGCAHSGGQGARVATSGSESVSADDLRFDADRLPPDTPALLYGGSSPLHLSFGDGLRCAGSAVVRLGTVTSDATGLAAWGPALGVQGGWSAGESRYFQVWYRDPAAFCTSDSFNLSHGVRVDFRP